MSEVYNASDEDIPGWFVCCTVDNDDIPVDIELFAGLRVGDLPGRQLLQLLNINLRSFLKLELARM